MEKIKAMGMNTVSFYSHWGYHAPTNDTLDFETGAHDIGRIYEIAKNLGLFVHARPGPYINAETSAGGMPLWLTTGEYGALRDNATVFTGAWRPYMSKVEEITAPFQVTNNGTVILYQIENEFPNQWSNVEEKIPRPVPIAYMETLFENAQSNGIVVPLTHNMPNRQAKAWSIDYDTAGARGNVHIYGLDNYPTCWSCIPSDCSTSNPSFTLMDYTAHFNEVSPKQPSMMPEFQGGALNPWDGPAEGCEAKTDESFVNFYYRDNVAQRVTILGLYMIHGGTNWGWIGAPFVPTSYGYSAAIAENRTIGSKYYEIKSLALFTRAAKDLTKTDIVGNSTSYTDNEAITTIELRNPDTDAGFYAIRHTDPTSSDEQSLRLSVRTSAGNFTVPIVSGNDKMSLNGHVAKILVTDFNYGRMNLVYSTAEVLTYGIFDSQPILVLWVFNGEGGEFFIEGATSGKVVGGDASKVQFVKPEKGLIANFKDQTGMTVVTTNEGARVLLMDRDTAHLFWVPALTTDPTVPVDQVAFVQGPHLVRGAQLEGSVISIRGDSNETKRIEVFAAKQAKTIRWNGKRLKTQRTNWGSLTAEIGGPEVFETPKLGTWRVQDSLIERHTNYSDSGLAWVDADDMETSSQYDDATKPYLYSNQYGFHNGVHLWRGYFNGTADVVYLEVQGGIAHGWTAWLNGKFIGSFLGDLSSSTGAKEFSFPNETVSDKQNVLLVMQDITGHDQGSGSLNIRGIVNATLLNSESGFSSWKVAGTAGGATGSFLDPVRTHYNEGGLRAERLGWHLPGFDDSRWPKKSPGDGFTGAGVRFYRTHLPLDTPAGHDVALSVKLNFDSDETSNSFRGYIYINGYQYGRYYPYLNDAMNTFPAPPGVWNYNGDNVIGLAIWNQEEKEVKCDLEVKVEYVLASSLDVKFDGTYLRPGWDEKRLLYT
ncbi:glycoside hydrolase family 35 protein [Aspergillus mulundensis]|uniref:beta-galactosidase n=1 Tax=Aspergillus mulundensis TaxID=1810919 RepID=A0A3D8RA37_9EURO|nr:putative Beta-galactosidase [Aspergillus mulundensis]RDW70923.1 putative Beta-galactosidase [Aspergillus mulundensis]